MFVVGLSPDLLITSELNRLSRNVRYLETIFTEVDINKVCFDLDYSWNLNNRTSSDLDLTLPSRLEKILSGEELKLVLYDNAKKFFQ